MKPTLMFHVQHFLGIGHLVRAFALAEALTTHFRVLLVSGGRFPQGIAVPPNVTIAQLPALGVAKDRSTLVSHEPNCTVDAVLVERAKQLIEIYDAAEPDVLLVELFPFGRKKLAGELVPLLERARSHSRRPLIACSVRDILITGRHDQQRHDDRASTTASKFFDLIMVHGDQEFADLGESFRPTQPLTVPVEYTGFVAPPIATVATASPVAPNTVVVSAGGGWVGHALMQAGLDAAPIIARRHGLATTLITGPLANADHSLELTRLALAEPHVTVVQSVPGLLPTFCEAAASVSQAGYNTMLDIVRAGVPSVLVPYGDDSENEQPRRAERLASHGVATVVDPVLATGTALADAVGVALSKPAHAVTWNLNGATTAADLLANAVSTRTAVAVI